MDEKPKTPITQPAMPTQPATVAIEKVPAWAIALTEKVTTGFERQEANMGLMSSAIAVIEGRVTNLEEARNLDAKRADANSIKVRRNSENDLTQDVAIASIKTTVDATATEVAALKAAQQTAAVESAQTAALTVGISNALSGFWKRNPKLETALVGFILSVLALGTLWVSTLLRHP